MSVILGLNQGNRDVRLVVENVISPLGFAATDQLAAHNYAPLGEADLFTKLGDFIPARLAQGRGDKLGADIALAEFLLVHVFRRSPVLWRIVDRRVSGRGWS